MPLTAVSRLAAYISFIIFRQIQIHEKKSRLLTTMYILYKSTGKLSCTVRFVSASASSEDLPQKKMTKTKPSIETGDRRLLTTAGDLGSRILRNKARCLTDINNTSRNAGLGMFCKI